MTLPADPERYNPVLAGDQPIMMEHIRPLPVFHAKEDRGKNLSDNDWPDEDGLQFFALTYLSCLIALVNQIPFFIRTFVQMQIVCPFLGTLH